MAGKNEIVVFNESGNRSGVYAFEAAVIEKEMSPLVYAQGVRTLLQNWRQGTVKCKTRSEVAFSRKKPWKQKGTGRARAGTLRSPIWRKGGVTHGPQARVHHIDINKKQRKLIFNNILFAKLKEQVIYCLENLGGDVPRTAQLVKMLQNMGIFREKILVFLPCSDERMYMSLRNIEGLNIVYFDQPNVIDLTDCRYWLFLKRDKDLFEDMVVQWN